MRGKGHRLVPGQSHGATQPLRRSGNGAGQLLPDTLTGMEANLRFPGPETMETKIFVRLSAWQNWLFQRPSAVGEQGALKRYDSGRKPVYDRARAQYRT